MLISLISNAYVPLYAMYKAAENSYQSGYGRSDYDDYYDDDGYGYDRSGYHNLQSVRLKIVRCKLAKKSKLII